MAIYHCSVKVISRSAGRSAIACAAYRSGTRLHSEETDRTFDYRNKGGVVFSEIALCANAPERFLDRQTLWNSVQSVENKSDSRLAREIELALPIECSMEEWIEIGREYATYMTAQGMIADWSIHNPINKETGIAQNPHIHMMVTTRPIKPNGEWGAKEKKAYKLDANGERIPVIDKKTGEQKIGAKGRKMWQRETVDATGWDSKAKIYEWRERWSEVVNKHLEPEHHIDHRSYKDQGKDIIPTVHEGYSARALEQKMQAVDTRLHADLIEKNIEIKRENGLIEQIIAKVRALYERVSERVRQVFKPFGRALPTFKGTELGTEGIERAVERREREITSREREITRLEQEVERREISGLDQYQLAWRNVHLLQAAVKKAKKEYGEDSFEAVQAQREAESARDSAMMLEVRALSQNKSHRFTPDCVKALNDLVVEYESILESIKSSPENPFTAKRGAKERSIAEWTKRVSDTRNMANIASKYMRGSTTVVPEPTIAAPIGKRESIKDRLARAKEKSQELEEERKREREEMQIKPPEQDYDDIEL